MKKANVIKVEKMAADFLQYRYKIFCCMGRRDADWNYYEGACGMIESFGGYWQRSYTGGNSEEERNNSDNYSHSVFFPSDEKCARLNENAWSE